MKRPNRLLAVMVTAGLLGTMSSALAETVLKIRPFGDLKQIDPVITSDYMVRNHGYMVYDTLFSLDEKLVAQPQMLEAFTVSSDQLTYTFTLRGGLTFSNGQPVTAEDAVVSLKRWWQRDGLGQQLASVSDSLTVKDDKTFELKLKRPWGLVIEALSKPSSNVPFIMPKAIAATPADTAITDATGSGPFIMKKDEWVPGSKVVYVKNPSYKPRQEPASGLAGSKLAKVDRVEWHYIPDAQTALNALQAGEIDIFEEVPPDFLPTLAGNADIKTMPQDTLGMQMVFRMNTSVPPFNNQKVRQAISYMIDQEKFARAYVSDPKLYKNCPSFYMCSSPYFTADGWVKPDIEKAKKLIAESGYDGTPVVVLHATESGPTNTFSLVAEQLMRQIGLKVDPQAMDWGTLVGRRASKETVDKGGWSLFMSGPTGADMFEPVGHLGLRANCDKAWFGWPCDEQIEKLRNEFALATAPEQKKKIATDLQLRAVDYVPYWPAAQLYLVRAVRGNVDGIVKAAVPVYWNITKK
ncbi:ABC transporter substrate-binding protein [Bradyrhizobium sp. AS23.2]|uniref:ABC transporter substrate-binding protein n=1 Tax=Bradyrhizobium sp. AS23.2 TaxID=1680155 RepID=UPI00093FA920|nr:ABC transporter substrate-binding protein [Bradyrhizobium sp. AS23.2]OKO68771.1 ABC transporter substrate-binding protein [Bradyrhizobium sp. AS23.2]